MDDEAPIDEQRVRSAAMAGATDQEIADYFERPVEEVRNEFAAVLKQARAARAILLRKKETSVALEGNVSILQFLGKLELGQTDRRETFENEWSEPPLDAAMG
jgi:hypothetical protein